MKSNKVEALRKELEEVRRLSLQASREGDYLRVAKLTLKAAGLNQLIAKVSDDEQPDYRHHHHHHRPPPKPRRENLLAKLV